MNKTTHSYIWIAAAAFLFSAGCSDMQLPTGKEALNKPFGTGPEFTLGTTKAEVLEWWGAPDLMVPHGVDELGNPKVEWIYHGRMQGVPIDLEYVSRDKHLFFEGKSLVKSEMHDPRQGGTEPTSYTRDSL